MISSFSSPGGNSPDGITWDGTHLRLASSGSDLVHKLTTAGVEVSNFAAPGLDPKGLTWDGTHFWITSDTDDLVWKVLPDGTPVSSIPLPASDPFGMTWDGTDLWIADDVTLKIYRVNTAGMVQSSFNTPGTTPRGLTWDGSSLWHTDTSTDLIYKLSPTGMVLDSCPTPGTAPRGLGFDGTDFWLGDSGSGLVYRLGGPPPQLEIVKRAFQADGTPVASGSTLPAGMPIKFLLYISNPGGVRSDVSLRDVLDPLFLYVGGSIRYDNSVAACAGASCTVGEEAAIFAAADGGTVGTDPVNGDVVSFTGVTLDVGNSNAANAQLDIAAGKVWAVVFTIRVQ